MNLTGNLPKEKLQKLVMVGIGTVALIAVALQLHLGRKWRSYSESKREITRLSGEITDAERRQQELQASVGVREQLGEFVDAQQAKMVGGDALAWVVRELSTLADKHPVRVLSLRPDGGSGQAGEAKATTYKARLEVAGEYDQLGNFIRDLENEFPTAEIRSLEIAGNTSGPGKHQANLDLLLMVRPEPLNRKSTEKKSS